MSHEIKLIDAMNGLAELEDNSVDLILSDPAYGTLEQWREMGTTTRLKESKSSSNEWFDTVDNDFFGPFFKECVRVLKRDTYLMVMGDERISHVYYAKLREAGFADDRITFAYWRKSGKPDGAPCGSCGHQATKIGTRGMGYPFGQVVEKIVVAKRGKPKPPEDRKQRNDLGQYWIEEPLLKGKGFYPTQKPVPLLDKLLAITDLPEGSLIVDPFAGSGSTGEAAFNRGHNFLGFDVEQKAIDYFQERQKHWIYEGREEEEPSHTTPSGGILDLL